MASSSDTTKVGGVWHRVFEEEPIGGAFDRETLVLWTQAPKSGIYVDLRLPPQSPGRGDARRKYGIKARPSALSANGYSAGSKAVILQDPALLSVLLAQQSFAGVLDCQLGDTTKTKEALHL